jgi:putative heme-binding domain-containing protein
MLETVLREDPDSGSSPLLQELLSLAVALRNEPALARSLAEIGRSRHGGYEPWQFAAIGAFLDAVERKGGSLAQWLENAGAELQPAIRKLEPVFDSARRVALDTSIPNSTRATSIRLLGRGLLAEQRQVAPLTELLQARVPLGLQKAALANLGRSRDPSAADLLLENWRQFEPGLKVEVLNALLSRSSWVERLLGSVEQGKIATSEIPLPVQQRILAQAQSDLRARAQRLFTISSERKQLLADYRQVAELNGDTERGSFLFRQNCATCHRFQQYGFEVGPDLAALGSKSDLALLTAILDPNQAIESRYLNYTALTVDGREWSGIIVSESPSSITLRGTGGMEQTILRSDLEELSSSGLSLMPEGLEKVLSPQEMADLISYLRVKTGPG